MSAMSWIIRILIIVAIYWVVRAVWKCSAKFSNPAAFGTCVLKHLDPSYSEGFFTKWLPI